MYDEIYSLNFTSSFLLSTIFLIINIIFFFNIYFKSLDNKKLSTGLYQPILIFFLIFLFIQLF